MLNTGVKTCWQSDSLNLAEPGTFPVFGLNVDAAFMSDGTDAVFSVISHIFFT